MLFTSKCGRVAIVCLGAVLAGCVSGESESEPNDVGTPAAGMFSADYVLQIRPRERRVTLRRLTAPAPERPAGAGLSSQAVIDVNLQQDSIEGSGPANSVELVTDSATVVDTFGTAAVGSCPANSFCANVKLNSFWAKQLNHTYVQVTSITDSTGAPTTGHSGINSDTAPASVGLSNSLGLWKYQSSTVSSSHFSNGTTGVMLPGASNGATRTWKFANPDDADTDVYLKVMGSTTYSNYSLGTQFNSYLDACTVGAGESLLAMKEIANNAAASQPFGQNAQVYVQTPFSFTFYGTTYAANARVNFDKWAHITFGTSTAGSVNHPSVSDSNPSLPKVSAPRAAAFVFWDQLRWPSIAGQNAGMCAKLLGTAPNRQIAISWKSVGFAGAGPFMTFGAVINESSEEIWFNYKTMIGAGSPTAGATVGAQNEAGTVAALGSSDTVLTYANDTGKVLLPQP